jgi:hypothetical protein
MFMRARPQHRRIWVGQLTLEREPVCAWLGSGSRGEVHFVLCLRFRVETQMTGKQPASPVMMTAWSALAQKVTVTEREPSSPEFGTYSVRISVILAEVFRNFLRSLQANAGILPLLDLQSPPSKSFPVDHRALPFDAVYWLYRNITHKEWLLSSGMWRRVVL